MAYWFSETCEGRTVDFLYFIRFEAYVFLNRNLVEAWRLVYAKKVVSLGEEIVPVIGGIVSIVETPYRCTGIVENPTGTSYNSRCNFTVELWPANPTKQLYWPANGKSVVCHPLHKGETFFDVCKRLKDAGSDVGAQNPHSKNSFRVVSVPK